MFSKEWKLVALSLAAAITLTACPKNKKKSAPESAFKGYWVSVEAYQAFNSPATRGYVDCARMIKIPNEYGLVMSVANGGFALDALVIYGNGAVYQYQPSFLTARSAENHRQSYLGTINGNVLTSPGSLDPVAISAFAPNGMYQLNYISPITLHMTDTKMDLQGNILTVDVPLADRPATGKYLRLNGPSKEVTDTLDRMNRTIMYCTQSLAPVVIPGRPIGVPGRAVVIPGRPVGVPAQPIAPAPGSPEPYNPGDAGRQPGQQLPPAVDQDGQGSRGPAVGQQNWGNGYPYDERDNRRSDNRK